jgi:hypothetical protein
VLPTKLEEPKFGFRVAQFERGKSTGKSSGNPGNQKSIGGVFYGWRFGCWYVPALQTTLHSRAKQLDRTAQKFESFCGFQIDYNTINSWSCDIQVFYLKWANP